jgi:ATP-binding cassette subfamily B (MDR/TAP) protein 1
MGEGVILEHGTHSELLQKEDSAYSRLVRAQNLRGGMNSKMVPGVGINAVMSEEVAAVDEQLGSGTTSNEKVGDTTDIQVTKEKKDSYSFFYLFKRMAKLNRESRWDYLFGGFFSASK